MNSQLFLAINIVCVVIFTIWFLLTKNPGENPTVLKLNADLDPEGREKPPVGSSPIPNAARSMDVSKPLDPATAKLFAAQSYSRKSRVDKEERTVMPLTIVSNLAPTRSWETDPEATILGVKNLNVLFVFNGHDWDAHTVLGVPAGSSLKSVTDAYQKAIREVDRETLPFLEAAYHAILDNASKRKAK